MCLFETDVWVENDLFKKIMSWLLNILEMNCKGEKINIL